MNGGSDFPVEWAPYVEEGEQHRRHQQYAESEPRRGGRHCCLSIGGFSRRIHRVHEDIQKRYV